MRTLVPVWIVVGLVLAMGIWSAHFLDRTASHIVVKTEKVEGLVKSDQWAKASEEISRVRHEWTKVRKWWSVLIDHAEIDHIETTLARLSNLVETEEAPAALAETAELKKLLEHIPEKELVNLYNIL